MIYAENEEKFRLKCQGIMNELEDEKQKLSMEREWTENQSDLIVKQKKAMMEAIAAEKQRIEKEKSIIKEERKAQVQEKGDIENKA